MYEVKSKPEFRFKRAVAGLGWQEVVPAESWKQIGLINACMGCRKIGQVGQIVYVWSVPVYQTNQRLRVYLHRECLLKASGKAENKWEEIRRQVEEGKGLFA